MFYMWLLLLCLLIFLQTFSFVLTQLYAFAHLDCFVVFNKHKTLLNGKTLRLKLQTTSGCFSFFITFLVNLVVKFSGLSETIFLWYFKSNIW